MTFPGDRDGILAWVRDHLVLVGGRNLVLVALGGVIPGQAGLIVGTFGLASTLTSALTYAVLLVATHPWRV
jgi:hypothetical protein